MIQINNNEYRRLVATADGSIEQISVTEYLDGSTKISGWFKNAKYSFDRHVIDQPAIELSQKQLDNYIKWGVINPNPRIYFDTDFKQYIYSIK